MERKVFISQTVLEIIIPAPLSSWLCAEATYNGLSAWWSKTIHLMVKMYKKKDQGSPVPLESTPTVI